MITNSQSLSPLRALRDLRGEFFRRAATLALLCSALILLPACQQPLYDSRAPRSQYDRADSLRDTRPEQFVYNEYGTRKPNIRGRLLNQ